MTALRHILRRIGALGFDRRGGTAVTVALALPVLAALACGAIDLFAVNADRARVQAVADAAALMAAKQLGAGDVQSLKLRAEAYVQDQLGPIATRLRYTLAVATRSTTPA